MNSDFGRVPVSPETQKTMPKQKKKKKLKIDPMTQMIMKIMGVDLVPKKKEQSLSKEEVERQRRINREAIQSLIHENLQKQNQMLEKLTRKISSIKDDPFAEKKKYIKQFEKRIRDHHEAKMRMRKETDFQEKLSMELNRYLQSTSKYFLEAVGVDAPESLFEKEEEDKKKKKEVEDEWKKIAAQLNYDDPIGMAYAGFQLPGFPAPGVGNGGPLFPNIYNSGGGQGAMMGFNPMMARSGGAPPMMGGIGMPMGQERNKLSLPGINRNPNSNFIQ